MNSNIDCPMQISKDEFVFTPNECVSNIICQLTKTLNNISLPVTLHVTYFQIK